nr:MAG TPA: protein of unknown function (DUF5316) [Caudoviricetes sp.]
MEKRYNPYTSTEEERSKKMAKVIAGIVWTVCVLVIAIYCFLVLHDFLVNGAIFL